MIGYELRPKLLEKLDPRPFGFIPESNTTLALISVIHTCLAALDGTESTVRVALLDYRKAFDLVDLNLLVSKLFNFDIKLTVIIWVADLHRARIQRVKDVPAGIQRGTKIGQWLFLAKIYNPSITKFTTSNFLEICGVHFSQQVSLV